MSSSEDHAVSGYRRADCCGAATVRVGAGGPTALCRGIKRGLTSLGTSFGNRNYGSRLAAATQADPLRSGLDSL